MNSKLNSACIPSACHSTSSFAMDNGQLEYLNEKQCSNLLGGIAILHDCRPVGIDIPGQTIDIAGPPKSMDACAVALKTLLGRGEN